MRLYDYLSLMPEGNELTVWDKDYDIETYFYSDRPDTDDIWGKSMWKLTEVLDITTIHTNGVSVKLSDLIEEKLNQIKEADLFDSYDLENIMLDMPNILAGNVSENWIEQFVEILAA